MSTTDKLLLSFFGDDFTGSTDALESLTRAGARTILFLEPPTPETLARYPGLQAVGVAGMTRSLTPPEIEKVLNPALRALRGLGAPHVHYKVCSTFDSSPAVGSIGCVMDLAAKIFNAQFVPLLVGAPALGRHCVFGNLFARFGGEGEVHRLDRHPSMSRHPITPADESDLRLHLARQTKKRIGLFDILKVDLPLAEAQVALEAILSEGAEIVLFDVLYSAQLKLLGELIDAYASREQPLFSVGSSGIDMALGENWAAKGVLKKVESWNDPGPANPMLVASGSCSPVTQRQIKWALEHGFADVTLDTAALNTGESWENIATSAAMAVIEQLRSGRNVVVRSDATKEFSPVNSEMIGSRLGWVVNKIVRETKLRRVCVAGGDTSGHVARALGIEALEMIGPLAPGAPLCRAYLPELAGGNLEVVFKGGQVGNIDFFGTVMRGKP